MDQVETSTKQSGVREEFTSRGGLLLDRVRQIAAAGNVRRVIVKHDGRIIVEVPLTAGVVGTLLAPQLAALGAIAALVTESTIEVVRTDEPTSTKA